MAEPRKPDRLVAELTIPESKAVDDVLERLSRERGRPVTRKELTMEGVRAHAARLGVEMVDTTQFSPVSAAEARRTEAGGRDSAQFIPVRLKAILAARRMFITRLSRLFRSQWSAEHINKVVLGQRRAGPRLHLSLKRWLGSAYPYAVGSSDVLPTPQQKNKVPR